MNPESKISFKNLQIGYSGSILPYELNLELPKNAFIALMGVNGRGKSTLLKTMMGFQNAVSGEILLGGKNIQQYSAKQLAAELAVVLTDKIAVNNITAGQLIAFGRYPFINWMAKLAEEDEKYIRKAAEKCGVGHLLERHLTELSDGEKQKIMLARAVAQHTPFLLLDEPTAHLDVNNKVAYFKLLQEMSAEQTIIAATHELHYACQYCDYILLLDENQFYFSNPKNLISQGILNDVFPEAALNLR